MTWDAKAQKFLRETRRFARQNGVDIRWGFSRKTLAEDGERVWGFFQPPWHRHRGEIRVATGCECPTTILHTYAHEYAHFLYWRFRRERQPGLTYLAQEEHAEALAIRLLEEYGIDGRRMRKIRRASKAYLDRVRRGIPEPQ